ncbi:MAG: hypothetical protein KUG65_13275 [Sphingomonadaceae bacterium]|nr:hypothetical protein [Sphingomonadaceae bacterium]
MIGIIVAFLLRSHAGLLIALVIRFTTDLMDIANVLSLGDKGGQAAIPFVVILLVAPAITGSIYLLKCIKR